MDDIFSTSVLERSFEYEITFLYYLNLNSDFFVPINFPPNDYYLLTNAPLLPEKTREERRARQMDEYSLVP
jgi:hypothetical protein